jgi:hypothetical protein
MTISNWQYSDSKILPAHSSRVWQNELQVLHSVHCSTNVQQLRYNHNLSPWGTWKCSITYIKSSVSKCMSCSSGPSGSFHQEKISPDLLKNHYDLSSFHSAKSVKNMPKISNCDMNLTFSICINIQLSPECLCFVQNIIILYQLQTVILGLLNIFLLHNYIYIQMAGWLNSELRSRSNISCCGVS